VGLKPNKHSFTPSMISAQARNTNGVKGECVYPRFKKKFTRFQIRDKSIALSSVCNAQKGTTNIVNFSQIQSNHRSNAPILHLNFME